MDNLIRGSRLGLSQDGHDILVQDLCLKRFHAEAEVPDDSLEALVVRHLMESECPHLLQVELDTYNPWVNIISIDEVILGFDKVLVV